MTRLRTDNTACIVVDIQERLVPVLHQFESMVESSVIMLQGLKALGIPSAATEQYPKGLGHTLAAVKSLLADAPFFEKTQFSSLTPEVRGFLYEHRIENVVLIGAEAHVCMLQTVLGLRGEGLAVYVPFECTSSRNPANKANALEQMQAAGAVVSNVESVLFQLLGDAAHPAFKTVSKLIR